MQPPLTPCHPVGDECGGAHYQAQRSNCVPEKHEDAGTNVRTALA